MGQARGISAHGAGCLWHGGGSHHQGNEVAAGCPGVSLPGQHPQGMGPAPGGAGGRGGVCSPSPGAQGLPLLSSTSEWGTKASLLEIPGSPQRCARQSWAKEREQNKAALNVPQRTLLARRGELLCCRPEKEHARINNLSSPIKSVGISF